MNREKEAFEKQSREMRENYQKIKEGSIAVINPKKDKAKRLLTIIMIIYAIILITFVMLLYWVKDFRYLCYDILQQMSEQGHYWGALYIGVIGFVFVLTGFNVVLYDIMAGFLIRPFILALFSVSFAKFMAKYVFYKNRYVGFIVGRYKLRNFIYTAMNENIYFITCYLATERKSVKVMYLMQFLAVPTIFKTYACGLFKITQWEFVHPTIFGTVVWAAFWVYVGAKLESLSDVLQSGETSNFVPYWLKIVMAIIISIIVYYFIRLTNQIYTEIQNDADKTELSHILEQEEETHKLRLDEETQNYNSDKQEERSQQTNEYL